MREIRVRAIAEHVRCLIRGDLERRLPASSTQDALSDVEVALNELAGRIQHRESLYDVTQEVASQNATRLSSLVDQLAQAKADLEKANDELVQHTEELVASRLAALNAQEARRNAEQAVEVAR